MPRPKGWDVTKGKLSINGIPLVGFAKGDHISATYTEDRNTTHMSADAYGRHALNPNRNGTVTVNMSMSSPALTAMQTFVDAGQPLVIDYIDYTAVGAFFHCEDGVIQKEPDFVRADNADTVIAWVFTFTDGVIRHGTAVQE